LNAPVIESESPVASIASPIETMLSVEWNMSSVKNPIVLITVPISVSLLFLILFRTKPDIIVPISNTTMKGN